MTTAPAAQCDTCGVLSLVVSGDGNPGVGAVPQEWLVVYGPTPDPGLAAVTHDRHDFCSFVCLGNWANSDP